MADDSLQQRLTELEVRLTFVDDTVNALASADAELSMRLAALEDLIRGLRSELSALRTSQGHDPHSEPPPPHY
ncbi:SlyX protein [Dyella jiangningensis]|uniref:SlyX family protein n=1 Tax=Dyella sp. AtDHG13 TaxID=1938897 RepID=UPI000889B661|nr:SlyX family protein [Dyella sp. AtDHG13]PXV61394.1 SlyX protein [Dyella sp. AtDHG13]SDJ91670.1 SlyX protein [Dyella jiangningensis]